MPNMAFALTMSDLFRGGDDVETKFFIYKLKHIGLFVLGKFHAICRRLSAIFEWWPTGLWRLFKIREDRI